MDSEELESLKDFLKEKAAEEPVPEGEVWDEEEEEEPEEEKSDVVEIVEEVVPSKPPGFKEVNPILLFAIEKDLKMESQKKQEAFKEK
jgi:CO dehydrogenase/acetyl-CoA synthase beta subunit